ncbi:hypothetical protein BJX65DRAFT_261976 [Aspergillus insuetus]
MYVLHSSSPGTLRRILVMAIVIILYSISGVRLLGRSRFGSEKKMQLIRAILCLLDVIKSLSSCQSLCLWIGLSLIRAG